MKAGVSARRVCRDDQRPRRNPCGARRPGSGGVVNARPAGFTTWSSFAEVAWGLSLLRWPTATTPLERGSLAESAAFVAYAAALRRPWPPANRAQTRTSSRPTKSPRAGSVPLSRKPGHGNLSIALSYCTAQVDGLLAGKLGVTEAALAGALSGRRGAEVVAATEEQILGLAGRLAVRMVPAPAVVGQLQASGPRCPGCS